MVNGITMTILISKVTLKILSNMFYMAYGITMTILIKRIRRS